MTKPLVSVEWLDEHLNDESILILDASIPKVTSAKESAADQRVIPGSIRFDLKNDFSAKDGTFPNTFPSPEQFELGCRKLGINEDHTIVIWDDKGIYSSPRVWWMFKAMGHEKVYVLNGGLPAWIETKLETADQHSKPFEKGNFTANFNEEMVKGFGFIRENEKSNEATLIDARSSERFSGRVEEPRIGLRSGNIPGSINIPYHLMLEGNKFNDEESIHSTLNQWINNDKPIVVSCGSGVTACIVALAITMTYTNEIAIYDGSWTEYASIIPDIS